MQRILLSADSMPARRSRSHLLPWALAASLVGLPAAAQEREKIPVTFQLNDALIKGKVLPGVSIGVASSKEGEELAKGVTDEAGQAKLELAPGQYFVSYRKPGYVPLERSPTEIGPQTSLVTTTLSLMMEAEGVVDRRRIKIILNWGSNKDQVKDADSHLRCPCGGDNAHVYFSKMEHKPGGHSVTLDVDDRDWGGPETITLIDPPPGIYPYWVHNYSGPPALLGEADAVVRVLIGDQVAGEYRTPRSVTERFWRPFKALDVTGSLEVRIVAFTPAELAAGMDRQEPEETSPPAGPAARAPTSSGSGAPPARTRTDEEEVGSPVTMIVLGAVLVAIILGVIWYIRRRGRGRG